MAFIATMRTIHETIGFGVNVVLRPERTGLPPQSQRAWLLSRTSGSSRTQQRLDGSPLVHGAVAFRDLVQRQRQIEDLPRVDLAAPYEFDELGQITPHRGRTTVEVDMRVEQLLAIEIDTMRHTHIADPAA